MNQILKLPILHKFKIHLFTMTSLALLSFSITSNAIDTTDAELIPAIDGYSPVSYFTENKAEKGNSEFNAEHQGKIYFFTSAEQLALFTANPEKYKPRHDVCAYNLALGKITPLDPTNFKIIAGSLLLFHKSDAGDGLQAWEQSEISEEELLRRADYQFSLRF